MSVRFYDEAIANRIQSWVKDPNLVVLKPDETAELFKIKLDQGDDKPLTLPLIAISREPEIRILNRQRRPMTYDGYRIKALDKNGNQVKLDSTFKLTAVPIRIAYQIDIYTKNIAEADEYAREFVFRLINKPTIAIEIPYNGVKLKHKSTITLEDTIRDNSDIPERRFKTQFTRYTIYIEIDDAYYFGVEDERNLSISEIEVSIETRDLLNNALIDEELVYSNVK